MDSQETHLPFDRVTEFTFAENLAKQVVLGRKKHLIAQARKAAAEYEKQITSPSLFGKSAQFIQMKKQAAEINAQWLDLLSGYENLIAMTNSVTQDKRLSAHNLRNLCLSQESEIIELKKTTAKLKIELMKSLINSVNIASRK